GAAGRSAATAGDGIEVTFGGTGARIAARFGASLLEVAEGHDQRIEAGCRMGVCGADPVAIFSGANNVSPPTSDERSTLERLGLDAQRNRMACCARISGPVTFSLTPDRGATAAQQPMTFAFDPAVRHV